MNDKERLDWLRLSRTENIGPITFYKLIDRFGSAGRAIDALPDMAKRGGKAAPLKAFSKDLAEKEIEKIQKFGARLIARNDDEYPYLLGQVEDAPPLITVKGHAHLLSKHGLGVVGARNASLAGRKIAEDFARKVGHAGYIITSGLARGIDGAAHTASLASGTVAVVAGGVDVIYPFENTNLYHQICEQGVVVAESPFGTEPLARHFPRRNRIISGLSLGVLIVEAALKSGSLITARQALDQNREVFAVPGSPLDPRAEGTNSLIRDGAHMTTSAEDILQVLRDLKLQPLREQKPKPWQHAPVTESPKMPEPSQALYGRVIENLNTTPIEINELIRALDAPIVDILTIILELELAGRIERQPGNKVNLI